VASSICGAIPGRSSKPVNGMLLAAFWQSSADSRETPASPRMRIFAKPLH